MTTEDIVASLATLKKAGLTFTQCLEAFGDPESPYIRGVPPEDSDLELTDPPVIIRGDCGAYITTWVWVSDRDVWQGPTDSNDGPCTTRNHYECDECGETWETQWSCSCDDECAGCGSKIQPYESDSLDLNGVVINEPEG
jgi:hypothetical protein